MGVKKWKSPLPSSPTAMPPSPRGRLLAVAGKFLVAFDTLVTGLTACALSVTCGDSSPKGRAKSTAGSFLIMPNTLVMNFTAWLSLRGKTSPAPGEDVTVGDKRGNLARERLRGRVRLTRAAPHPALRATFPRWVKASAMTVRFWLKRKVSGCARSPGGSCRAATEGFQIGGAGKNG